MRAEILKSQLENKIERLPWSEITIIALFVKVPIHRFFRTKLQIMSMAPQASISGKPVKDVGLYA